MAFTAGPVWFPEGELALPHPSCLWPTFSNLWHKLESAALPGFPLLEAKAALPFQEGMLTPRFERVEGL